MALRDLSLAALVVAMTLLAACATTARVSDEQRLALYAAHAGEPVNSIRYTTPMGWEAVDDEHLLLNMRPRESYLLRLDGFCLKQGGSQLAIAVSHQAGVVSSGFDRVSVSGAQMDCRIREIRPVDIKAVHDEQRRLDATAS